MSDNGVFGTDPEEEQRLRAQTLQAARSIAEGEPVGHVPTVVGNLLAMYEKNSAIDTELVERVAQASWEASDGYVTGIHWPPKGFRAEKERRRVRAMFAVLSGQFPYVGQHVEWNPTGDEWKAGLVREVDGEHVHIVLLDNNQALLVEKRYLAWGTSESQPEVQR